eukprot:g16331.t1
MSEAKLAVKIAQQRVNDLKEEEKTLKAELATRKRDLKAARRVLAAAKNRLKRQRTNGVVVNFSAAPPISDSEEEEEEEEEDGEEEAAAEDPDYEPPPQPKGSTKKNRDPEIEALEVELKGWLEAKEAEGVEITVKILWARFVQRATEKGVLPGHKCWGFKPGNKHSWAQDMRVRQGILLCPVRQAYENPFSAPRLFSMIAGYFESSCDFFHNTALAWKPAPSAAPGNADDVVFCNVDEVGFEHETRGKVLRSQKNLKMPTCEKRKWKVSMGLTATSRPGFVIKPCVAIDRADADSHEAIHTFCKRQGICCKSGALNSAQCLEWTRTELLPAWARYKASVAKTDAAKAARLRLVLSLDNAPQHLAAWKGQQSFAPGCWALYLPAHCTDVMQVIDHKYAKSAKTDVTAVGSFANSPLGPELKTLHSRFRDWYAEQRDDETSEKYFSAEPLPAEWKEIKRQNLEVDEILNFTKKEGIYMAGVEKSWLRKDELKWLGLAQ